MQNFARLDHKWREFWKLSGKNLRFFEQNVYRKLIFSQFFTKYFLDFWLRSESINLWKITPDFYNYVSYFERGGAFLRPPDLLADWHFRLPVKLPVIGRTVNTCCSCHRNIRGHILGFLNCQLCDFSFSNVNRILGKSSFIFSLVLNWTQLQLKGDRNFYWIN